MKRFKLKTKSTFELLDITHEVQKIVNKAGVSSGVTLVFSPHTTAGIICNEAEGRLKADILKVAQALKNNSEFFGGFDHDPGEGNATAHITTSFSGNSRAFIIEDGKLVLGTWQSIMFLEMDGPRERQVWVKIISSP